MLKRHPLLTFFLLAFLLSWYPWVISLIRNSGNGGPNPLGVFLAAIIVTAITEGRTGLKEFFSRLIRWRVGIQWYALIFLLPFVLCAISALLIVFAAGAVPDFSKLPVTKDRVERFIFIFLFIGLGEEPGWRGFALEHLQIKWSPIKSSMLLGSIWAFWHLPLMGTEFTLPVIPAFVIGVFAATFIQTWIYNNTRHSVFLQMLFHAAVNTIGAGWIFPLFSGVDVIKFWYVYAAPWAVTAAIPFLMQRQVRPSLRGAQEQLSR
jgi:membrane protease YdiL (CAAX protease family)